MGGVRRALRSLGWGRSSGRDDQAQPVWLLRGDARHEPLHGHGGDEVSRAGERRLAAALARRHAHAGAAGPRRARGADEARRSHPLAGRRGTQPGRAVRRCGPGAPRGVGLGRRHCPGQRRALRRGAPTPGEAVGHHAQPRGGRVRGQRGRPSHLHEPGGGQHARLVRPRDRRRRPRGAGGGDAGLPPRARPAGDRSATQRHQLRHPFSTSRRVVFPRDDDRVTRRGRRVAFGCCHRLPRHLRAQGVRGAAGPARLPGRADRSGQPPAPSRPSRPRAAPGGSDRQPGRGALLRHRPLQAGQRQPGPPGGRRAAARHRGPPAPCRAAGRHALPFRW